IPGRNSGTTRAARPVSRRPLRPGLPLTSSCPLRSVPKGARLPSAAPPLPCPPIVSRQDAELGPPHPHGLLRPAERLCQFSVGPGAEQSILHRRPVLPGPPP